MSGLEQTADTVTDLLTVLSRSGFAVEKALWPVSLTEGRLPDLTAALDKLEKPLEEQYFAARQSAADLARGQEEKRAELDAVSGGKWVYPHGDAATKVRDAVNAELKSRGMTPDAKIFCELLSVADESWQDCVEACLGDRRFDILVPPNHYAAAKSAFVALGERVGPISLLDTPGIRSANRRADTPPADSLAGQVESENPLAAQYADTILRRIVCCDTPAPLKITRTAPPATCSGIIRSAWSVCASPSGISASTPAGPAPVCWKRSWLPSVSAAARLPRPKSS